MKDVDADADAELHVEDLVYSEAEIAAVYGSY
jgi:hypothetical protein